MKVTKLQSTGHVSSVKLASRNIATMTSRRSTPFWPLPRPKWKKQKFKGPHLGSRYIIYYIYIYTSCRFPCSVGKDTFHRSSESSSILRFRSWKEWIQIRARPCCLLPQWEGGLRPTWEVNNGSNIQFYGRCVEK